MGIMAILKTETPIILMKQPFLICVLAILTIIYFYNPAPKHPATARAAEIVAPAQPVIHTVPAPRLAVAPAPSSYSRWKTGPTAQNDWKFGPNAQTTFEPFAPSEQANWNQHPGYSIIAGARLR